MSDDTAKLIDQEIRGLITAGEQKARQILQENIESLHRVAKGLLEYETLSGDEVKALMRGENIVRRDDNDGSKGPASSAVPTAGRSKPREEPDAGGMAPQPGT